MDMNSSAQQARHQEIMGSETLESMVICTKPHQEKKSITRPADQQVQKCPRCDSINTKFCYYNNYSLSQPRYFCKSCRRYWTKGGTLRNVPVGGGCRKNKRPSSSSSSSSKRAMHDQRMTTIPPNLSNFGQLRLDEHDKFIMPGININPNVPLVADYEFGFGNVYYGLDDGSSGTGLMRFDQELSGAVNQEFQWQMSNGFNGGDGNINVGELSWINEINGHGVINTPLM